MAEDRTIIGLSWITEPDVILIRVKEVWFSQEDWLDLILWLKIGQ